jgi:hypothetical protein
LLRAGGEPYGSGQFIKDLREHFAKDDRVVTSEIRDKDAIVDSSSRLSWAKRKSAELDDFAAVHALERALARACRSPLPRDRVGQSRSEIERR